MSGGGTEGPTPCPAAGPALFAREHSQGGAMEFDADRYFKAFGAGKT